MADKNLNSITFPGLPDKYKVAQVADEYSSSSTYAVGDIVNYLGTTYRCTTAITTEENWTAGHWTAVKIADEVTDLKSAINEFLPEIYKKQLVFNRYGLNRSNGASNTNDSRLHTPLSSCVNGDLVLVPHGYKFSFFYFSSDDGYVGNSFDNAGGWFETDNPTPIPFTGLFSIVISKTNEENFTQQECEELNEKVTVYSSSAVSVDGIIFGAGHIDTTNQSGYWGLKGNDYFFKNWENDNHLSDTRWRTENTIKFDKGSSIEIKNGYRFYIFNYTNGSVELGSWLTDRYVFTENSLVRIIVDTVGEKVTYTEWDDLNEIISFTKADINNLHNRINDTNETIDYILESRPALRVGEFINGHLKENGIADDSYTPYRISTPEIVAFPCGSNKKIKVNISSDYIFAMRTGATSTNLNHNLYWFSDGDEITIPDGDNYYAISIANAKGGSDPYTSETISPNDDHGLILTYEDEYKVVQHHDDASKRLDNARLFFSLNETNTLDKYVVIGHTSDCHGDYKRVENFLDFCDNSNADVACVTGDIVSYQPSQQIKWFNDLLLSHKVLPAVCTGNHDVYGNSLTDSDIYDFMFEDIATKIGNTTGKTWYYKDLANKKIRIISVNLYQYGGESRWYTHFTSEQLSWIVSTMASTPDNYGIIILSHASQVNLDNAKDANYGDFFQDTRLYNNTHNSVSGGVPLYDIVDAFISRTTLSKTYTQTGSPSSVSVSADFTNVDASVEFIAHLTGHFHQDSICYVPNRTNRQLMLNVTCTNAIYGGAAYPYLADIQDQARHNTDVTQDAFNMYVIDRDNKIVKVIRVGNDITYQMEDRKYMEIPY